MKEHRHVFTTWLMDKEIPIEDMMMKMLASHPSNCVTSWQAYDINGYTYYTKEKDKKSAAQNSGIRIEAIDPQGLKATHNGYIQDIWELDYGLRIRIPVFRCQWIKHPNGVNVDNYGLTLVDLKILDHKDDLCVLDDHVTQVFYVLNPETEKHIVAIDNVEDNDEYVNQFEEMPLFTNPMNIKHIEKDSDKNLLLYM
jgi:hypothetical protein